MITLGAWIDSPAREVNQPAWWGEFRDFGFTTGAIMVESFKDGLDERWEDDQIAHAGVLARANDVELVLTFVPEPKRKYLEEFERRAPVLCELAGAAGLDMDCEGNMLAREVEGFDGLTAAKLELLRIYRGFRRKLDLRLEVDTYPFHAENSESAELAPEADRVYPQGYPVRHRKDGTGKEILVEWEDRFGPLLMPHTTLDRTLRVRGVRTGKPRLCYGAAAYDQIFPGHTPEEAMWATYLAATSFNPFEIRYWSTKWILGKFAQDRTPYAARFFRSLPAKLGR